MAFVFHPLKVNLMFTWWYCTGDPDAYFSLCALGNLQCELLEFSSLLPGLCTNFYERIFFNPNSVSSIKN